MQFTGAWYEVERTRYSHAVDWENTRIHMTAHQNDRLMTASYTGTRYYLSAVHVKNYIFHRVM